MMKNEISRKLTSITLMSIMVAGGITFAVPGEVPQAAAQGTMLTVSATASPHTGNVFGGPQVIEIVVNDPDTDSTTTTADDKEGVSEVEVDGNTLSMMQANNGKWYTYIVAESAVANVTADTGDDDLILAAQRYLDRLSGTPTDDNYDVANPINGFLGKALDAARNSDGNDAGDVKVTSNNIHIVDVDGEFDIVYKSETITVEYDEDITPGISVDRNDAPPGSQVHTTITDFRLNLDPTEADVWTFTLDDKKHREIGTTPTTDTTTDWDLGPNDGGFDVTYPAGESLDFNKDPVLKALYDAVLTAFNLADSTATTVNDCGC